MRGIREYNTKINSLRNTRKITSSMKMVSSVKFQRYSRIQTKAFPYWNQTRQLLQMVTGCLDETNQSLLIHGFPKQSQALIFLITGDRGMCGQFNRNAIWETLRLHQALKSNSLSVSFAFGGEKGATFFRKRSLPVQKMYKKVSSGPSYEKASLIGKDCLDLFLKGKFHEIWMVYTISVSSLEQKTISERLLPLPNKDHSLKKQKKISTSFLYESSENVLKATAKLDLYARIHKALIQSAISENSARISAMDSATTNCDTLTHRYVQLRNRARQASITTELSEIVTGKEALEQ